MRRVRSSIVSPTAAAVVLALMLVIPALAEDSPAPVGPTPTTRPVAASQPAAAASQPATDPFAGLRVVVPRAQLGPLRSVRIRDQREKRKGRIKVKIRTTPKDAKVLHGGRLLGKTPLTLTAERNSTPLDIVIRARGYMTLRTRIMRRVSRTYYFKLHPAKLVH